MIQGGNWRVTTQGNELSFCTVDLALDVVDPVHLRLDFIAFVLGLLDEITDFPLFIGLHDPNSQQKNRFKYRGNYINNRIHLPSFDCRTSNQPEGARFQVTS